MSLFAQPAPKQGRKSRYTLSSDAVPADTRGGMVGLGVNGDEIPYLVYDRATVVEAVQLHAVQTALIAGAIPIGDLVALYKGAGKLDALATAVTAAAGPPANKPK